MDPSAAGGSRNTIRKPRRGRNCWNLIRAFLTDIVTCDDKKEKPAIVDNKGDSTHASDSPGRPVSTPIPPILLRSSLGTLDVLPNELLIAVILDLDLKSIVRFSRVCYRAKQLTETLKEFREVSQWPKEAKLTFHGIGLREGLSIIQIMQLLSWRPCNLCHNLGLCPESRKSFETARYGCRWSDDNCPWVCKELLWEFVLGWKCIAEPLPSREHFGVMLEE